MEIEYKKIKDIHPYERNPRRNEKAVEYVANSIREFGFKSPIVVDKDGVIVAGHTRLQAAKRLKYKEVPCIVADDLTDEQVKAYRLADNRVAEKAEWDEDLLNFELGSILDIDMEQFDFSLDFTPDPEPVEETEESETFETEEEEEEHENARERTYRKNNFDEYDPDEAVGFYDMPILEPTDYIPERLTPFHDSLSAQDKTGGVHFYIDDYKFERVWDRTRYYAEKLEDYDCVLTPDFSLYTDMPMALKVWNVWRSRMVGQIFQNMGLTVIPTIQWAEKETFDFCFDGIVGGVVSVSTIGVKGDEEKLKLWADGMDEAIRRINPTAIVVYGGAIDYDFKGIKVVYFDNNVAERIGRNYGK